MVGSLEPTHEEKKDIGIIESHTNYSTETNPSEKNEEQKKVEDVSLNIINPNNN